MTLRRTLARTIARNLLVVAALVLSFLAMRAAIGETLVIAPADVPASSITAPEAIVLLDAHDCWTGDAPADMRGVLPGHVVVVIDGDARLGGERMVGKALDQLFGDVDHGLTVVGFCR